MFTKDGWSNFMKQALEMQEKMEKIKKEISEIEVTGESGAGLVKITINGSHNCKKVDIDSSLLTDSKEMLEDLTAAAFNDANRKISEEHKKKMASISKNTNLPNGLNLPF